MQSARPSSDVHLAGLRRQGAIPLTIPSFQKPGSAPAPGM